MAKEYPTNWTYKHGAFYYIIPKRDRENFGGKSWYRLGSTLPEAFLEWSTLIGDFGNEYRTMNKIFDRYMAEIAPKKAPSTYKVNQKQILKLKTVFGHMSPTSIKPLHIYQYMDARIEAPVSANREVALLSHIFTLAIRWGAVEANPCINKKVVRNKEKPRDRYITDDEFSIFYNDFAGEFLQAYIKVKYLIGQRKADVLRIKLTDLQDDGIVIKANKTQKSFLISWTKELKEAIKQAKAINRKIGTIHLFATRTGQPYVKEDGETSGFDSIWQRRMKLYVEAGNERFNEHDIRAKTASDTNVAHATDLMMHRSKEFTERVYRRKLKVVSPLK